MPHVDELLGPATFAAAGLFAAISLQPPVVGTAPARATPSVASAAAPARAAAVLKLPAVEVVARRSHTLAQVARDDTRPSDAGKPRV